MNVRRLYAMLVSKGLTPKDAAKQVQEKTGLSAVTGRPINKQLKFTKQMIYYGQYGIRK